MKIGEAIYKQGGAGDDGDSDGGGASQEGVVDAEFEEVDGDNKRSA